MEKQTYLWSIRAVPAYRPGLATPSASLTAELAADDVFEVMKAIVGEKLFEWDVDELQIVRGKRV